MEIGRKIQDYVIVRELGAGAMGAVYEARHCTIGRDAAIKVLHPHIAADERLVFRFVNEGRAASVIGHPGVVDVYDCGQLPDGTVYLIMELLKGESLGRRLRRVGRLGASETLSIGHQIALVLTATHARGVVHRDLKPDNVMLVPDPARSGEECVKILDFGIAKLSFEHVQTAARDLLTGTEDILGTPLYMAPEQCRSAKHLDGKADVYALGVLLYRMLAGDTPFRGTTLGELVEQHVRVPPPHLGSFDRSLPTELVDLVHRMLVKYPLQRPSAAEVAGAMARLRGLPTPSLPPARVEGPLTLAITAPAPRLPDATVPARRRSQLFDDLADAVQRHPRLTTAALVVVAYCAMQLMGAIGMAWALFTARSGGARP